MWIAIFAAAADDDRQPSTLSDIVRLLILGGTRWIGPYFVRAAVAAGHQVSVFNRGITEASLPDSVERLVGDRNDDLAAITGRDWDAVLDLATYGPGWVRSVGEALGGRCGHYTFISTVMVYDRKTDGEFDEESAVLEYEGDGDPYSMRLPYGEGKVLCEREAEAQFPGRTLVIRLGHPVGPGDWEGSFTYWTERVARGGVMLAAGEPDAPVQVIDIRDVAEWSIHMVERQATGVYNLTGPIEALTLAAMIDALDPTAPPPRVSWVPASVLAARDDRAHWQRLLFWTEEDGYGWIMRMNIDRARNEGLKTRPLAETAADTLAWYRSLRPDAQESLLASSWEAYLEREAEALKQ